jgi:CheY-like chemotaxis protein
MNTCTFLQKVVLIDDNETTNFLNERLLRRLGVAQEVVVFTNAQEGFQYLLETSTQEGSAPALVFADMRMPGLDGIEFLELYHTLDAPIRRRIKLTVLTTSMLPADRARVAAYPEVEYLVKPLSREKLERLLAMNFQHLQCREETRA